MLEGSRRVGTGEEGFAAKVLTHPTSHTAALINCLSTRRCGSYQLLVSNTANGIAYCSLHQLLVCTDLWKDASASSQSRQPMPSHYLSISVLEQQGCEATSGNALSTSPHLQYQYYTCLLHDTLTTELFAKLQHTRGTRWLKVQVAISLPFQITWCRQ